MTDQVGTKSEKSTLGLGPMSAAARPAVSQRILITVIKAISRGWFFRGMVDSPSIAF
jgi:hypothetical protein